MGDGGLWMAMIDDIRAAGLSVPAVTSYNGLGDPLRLPARGAARSGDARRDVRDSDHRCAPMGSARALDPGPRRVRVARVSHVEPRSRGRCHPRLRADAERLRVAGGGRGPDSRGRPGLRTPGGRPRGGQAGPGGDVAHGGWRGHPARTVGTVPPADRRLRRHRVRRPVVAQAGSPMARPRGDRRGRRIPGGAPVACPARGAGWARRRSSAPAAESSP